MLVARHSIQQWGSTLKHASRGSGISSRESVVPRKTFEGNIRAAEANTRRALIPMTAEGLLGSHRCLHKSNHLPRLDPRGGHVQF